MRQSRAYETVKTVKSTYKTVNMAYVRQSRPQPWAGASGERRGAGGGAAERLLFLASCVRPAQVSTVT